MLLLQKRMEEGRPKKNNLLYIGYSVAMCLYVYFKWLEQEKPYKN